MRDRALATGSDYITAKLRDHCKNQLQSAMLTKSIDACFQQLNFWLLVTESNEANPLCCQNAPSTDHPHPCGENSNETLKSTACSDQAHARGENSMRLLPRYGLPKKYTHRRLYSTPPIKAFTLTASFTA
jgi:hypothetical protein